ncbi:Ribonuclease P protein component [Thioalkalivibrio nitratireducens DSM 14787]|uniref:Ribonuclease P protein component n=1 Tax=Thioalkalivibrio nitratireducens (strain DSM 14787 / UNIQEM 213 / ALEN2) TaxID=1255043 RepID=L0E2L0_THIND|nr:ribonuclease P protein component [Thioalkalivibrio nitratireducens]AGA35435.1 Ribonuclease P protein component [Thioalkalivibrio nitratireducens DSM 14787]
MSGPAPTPGDRFPRSLRLLDGRAFQRVFARARRIPGRRFMLLYRVCAPPLDHPRLGLAISKKHARRAVDRNRIKRVAREAFRARRRSLIAVDIVVLSRAGIADAGSRELRAELDQLLEHVK